MIGGTPGIVAFHKIWGSITYCWIQGRRYLWLALVVHQNIWHILVSVLHIQLIAWWSGNLPCVLGDRCQWSQLLLQSVILLLLWQEMLWPLLKMHMVTRCLQQVVTFQWVVGLCLVVKHQHWVFSMFPLLLYIGTHLSSCGAFGSPLWLLLEFSVLQVG